MMRTKTFALLLVGSLAFLPALTGCAAKASFQAGGGEAPTPPPVEEKKPEEKKPEKKDEKPKKSEAKVSGDKVNIPGQIEFESGKATFKEGEGTTKTLEQVKLFLDANPRVTKLRIEGHTDNVGSAPTNLELSGQRALAVKTYVVQQGVAKERIIAVGCGQEKPVADNSTDEGKAKNRRTEFRLAEISGKNYLGHDPTGGCKTFE
jgi:OOP family OmpA-OmpF porin